jgi:hypothetical protein
MCIIAAAAAAAVHFETAQCSVYLCEKPLQQVAQLMLLQSNCKEAVLSVNNTQYRCCVMCAAAVTAAELVVSAQTNCGLPLRFEQRATSSPHWRKNQIALLIRATAKYMLTPCDSLRY